jgi:hypothetical protein
VGTAIDIPLLRYTENSQWDQTTRKIVGRRGLASVQRVPSGPPVILGVHLASEKYRQVTSSL